MAPAGTRFAEHGRDDDDRIDHGEEGGDSRQNLPFDAAAAGGDFKVRVQCAFCCRPELSGVVLSDIIADPENEMKMCFNHCIGVRQVRS